MGFWKDCLEEGKIQLFRRVRGRNGRIIFKHYRSGKIGIHMGKIPHNIIHSRYRFDQFVIIYEKPNVYFIHAVEKNERGEYYTKEEVQHDAFNFIAQRYLRQIKRGAKPEQLKKSDIRYEDWEYIKDHIMIDAEDYYIVGWSHTFYEFIYIPKPIPKNVTAIKIYAKYQEHPEMPIMYIGEPHICVADEPRVYCSYGTVYRVWECKECGRVLKDEVLYRDEPYHISLKDIMNRVHLKKIKYVEERFKDYPEVVEEYKKVYKYVTRMYKVLMRYTDLPKRLEYIEMVDSIIHGVKELYYEISIGDWWKYYFKRDGELILWHNLPDCFGKISQLVEKWVKEHREEIDKLPCLTPPNKPLIYLYTLDEKSGGGRDEITGHEYGYFERVRLVLDPETKELYRIWEYGSGEWVTYRTRVGFVTPPTAISRDSTMHFAEETYTHEIYSHEKVATDVWYLWHTTMKAKCWDWWEKEKIEYPEVYFLKKVEEEENEENQANT